MAGEVSFTWDKSPADLAAAVERFSHLTGTRIQTAARAEAAASAADMKRDRPWRDISGNARSGLRGEVRLDGWRLTLFLIHSAEYGKDLELARAGRYAVIVPTLHGKTIPRLQRRLKGVANR
jgi:hypothetical protein